MCVLYSSVKYGACSVRVGVEFFSCTFCYHVLNVGGYVLFGVQYVFNTTAIGLQSSVVISRILNSVKLVFHVGSYRSEDLNLVWHDF